MQNGLLITDATRPDNPIVFCNDAFALLTGYEIAEILGKNCRFLQHGDRSQQPIPTLRRAIAEGTACRLLLRNYRKSGELFWNELTISPVTDVNGQLTHFVGIQNDITDLVGAYADRWKESARLIETLAPRQKQVMDGLVAGRNIKQIAIDLKVSPKTAEMHRATCCGRCRLPMWSNWCDLC